MGIKENLTKIKEQTSNNDVKIIAVTKYATFELINVAYKLGINDFGESYVQDALLKISQQKRTDNLKKIRWHLIGKLQKNKVKLAVGNFYLIHSVDSIELAELINKKAIEKNLVQDILLQVNISGEASKSGFKREEILSSFKDLLNLANINVKGLMTIAPKTDDKDDKNESIIRNCFLSLSTLKGEINKKYMTNLKELSMGMSDDYKVAIQCGATMVRIGRAIFKEGG